MGLKGGWGLVSSGSGESEALYRAASGHLVMTNRSSPRRDPFKEDTT